jgi:alpha-glucosidase (family GH31 glycosyl hydrolase)
MRRSLAAVVVLVGIAFAALASAAGAAGRVDAGALVARTTTAPWGLAFVERSGRVVLRQDAGTGSGPTGTLGFGADGRWFHATRAVAESRSGGRYTATLATSDPRGRRLVVRVRRDAAGVIELTARVSGPAAAGVSRTGIAFAAAAGERYLGFGERSNAVDQRGREVESYVAEGPFEPDERQLVPAFVPAWGFHPRDDATYFPMPWLLSTAGYGVLVDSPEPSVFRLGTDSRRAWSAEVESSRLSLRVFAGPRPADVLRRLTARIGRQPAPPAPFVFGPWYQPRDDEQAILARLQRADVPLSVAQTYTHYLPCESQAGRRGAERERVGRFHGAGLAVTTYFNPMICTGHTRYGDAAARGALVGDPDGGPYVFPYSTLQRFLVSTFDFTAAAGRDLYGRLLREALTDGHDGWMEDFGEYTPLDARAAHGAGGPALHNLYPAQYHCGAFAAAPQAVRFVRSGWTGSARCSTVVWGGDPSVDWGFDGLRSVVTNGLTMGLSGVSTWGSDIGGFFSLFENRLSRELLIRWIQLGAVSGVMRTQADGIRIPDSARPQVWDADVVGDWRRWAKLRTQLYPYLAAADRTYRRTGLPIMRHLALAYPGDRRAVAQEDEFLFGPDLLAAPVVTEGAVRRKLYLPPGRWIDVWRSARYRERDGGLTLGRARVLRGGRDVTLPAPLTELPLLARAGTLLALLPPDVDTLARYGDRAPAVSLGERDDRRVLLAFPRGRSSAALEDGGTLRSRELRDGWELAISSTRTRRWEIEASLDALRRPFRPCAVRAAGGRLGRWRFDRATGVLHATFTARRGRLMVRSCGR